MGNSYINQLIINSPYEEPNRHWIFDRHNHSFELKEGRRLAGYFIASNETDTNEDPGFFQEIPLANKIRHRVRIWRDKGRPGITSITRRLLEYWTDKEEYEIRRFFFCQIEAVETLIWLTEAAHSDKLGLEIPSDGSDLQRYCTKMATGTGKTIVMAMTSAWHILNKVSAPQDTRFSKNILIVAPGLTVKSRLSVLDPTNEENYYSQYRIVPTSMFDKLQQGSVLVHNWHALNWETGEKISKKRSVDKRGAKSDRAYVREVLGEMSDKKNILVINDEAHHAWRINQVNNATGIAKSIKEEATKWTGALDRIQRVVGILKCYDFSATPFIPTGRQNAEDTLFGWIVSDFGLNDAIESGLVKTPRVVVRENLLQDTSVTKSRLYHLYNDPDVKDDINRGAKAHEPLPDLLLNAYYLLGSDWLETANEWNSIAGKAVPPVMITVANRTETAARINYAFNNRSINIGELCNPDRTLHIDSKVLHEAESTEEPIKDINYTSSSLTGKQTKKERAEFLRRQVDTIGQIGKPGEQIQNVISVGMLSEGWDAKNVTHIMGLRAFTSQLLCEQVVGRGLRRTSYEINQKTGFFDPEYVNVFGVPFTYLPHEGNEGTPPTPSKQKTLIEIVPSREQFEITWPNIERIDHRYTPQLSLDWNKLDPLKLSAEEFIIEVDLAPTIDGKPDVRNIDKVQLEELARKTRLQTATFNIARQVYKQMEPTWDGNEFDLIGQLVRLTEEFIDSGRLIITPTEYDQDIKWRQLILTYRMSTIVRHIWSAIRFQNTMKHELIFDINQPILSTGYMRKWFTGKKCKPTEKSHINYCVCDSSWEAEDADTLNQSPHVAAWAKNDHLGFEITYLKGGIVKKYRPDYLIKLKSGDMLVLETKGVMRDSDKVKLEYLAEWVKAVNSDGRFGRWHSEVSDDPASVQYILERINNINACV